MTLLLLIFHDRNYAAKPRTLVVPDFSRFKSTQLLSSRITRRLTLESPDSNCGQISSLGSAQRLLVSLYVSCYGSRVMDLARCSVLMANRHACIPFQIHQELDISSYSVAVSKISVVGQISVSQKRCITCIESARLMEPQILPCSSRGDLSPIRGITIRGELVSPFEV